MVTAARLAALQAFTRDVEALAAIAGRYGEDAGVAWSTARQAIHLGEAELALGDDAAAAAALREAFVAIDLLIVLLEVRA